MAAGSFIGPCGVYAAAIRRAVAICSTVRAGWRRGSVGVFHETDPFDESDGLASIIREPCSARLESSDCGFRFDLT
jgi:hypothetical protein